jgi:hypothetical protein
MPDTPYALETAVVCTESRRRYCAGCEHGQPHAPKPCADSEHPRGCWTGGREVVCHCRPLTPREIEKVRRGGRWWG